MNLNSFPTPKMMDCPDYGVGSGFETVKELCPENKVLEGFSITGGIKPDGQLFAIKDEKAKEAEKEVKKWLQKIKVI